MRPTVPDPALVIRPARPTLTDAHALLEVERHSLGDSPYTPVEVLGVLRRPEHHAYLALRGGWVVGFCSAIETPTDGGPRLELDMLGVLPSDRRRGIATALLRAAMADAQSRGVQRFRGVVAVDNVASQRAFAAAGLRCASSPRDLTVYALRGDAPLPYLPEGWRADTVHAGVLAAPTEPPRRFGADGAGREVLRLRDAAGRAVALAEVQQVHTLAYTGLWLERHWVASPRALLVLALGLVERARALDLDEVGYLAPTGREEAVTWVRAGYYVAGRYAVYTGGGA
jgi:ribosomal protein S18 acetylase RimI-like enzyme